MALKAQERAVLLLLTAAGHATYAEIDAVIASTSPVPSYVRKVVVCRARKHLPPGRFINNVYGTGYRVEDEPKPIAPKSTPLEPVRINGRPS
jgi:DNA-binding response OmpR family regulator